jgi:glutathione synthase/RimK-type ligase-like ATP-grasp enzyme
MIWIKIKKVNKGEDIIYFPQSIAETLPKQPILQFGLRRMEVNVKPMKDIIKGENNTFDNPIEIHCCEEIIKKLLIVETLVYQLIYKEGTLYIGPVIGFLLGQQFYYYDARNMKGLTKSMGIYHELGGLFIAFKDISIDWSNKIINGLYYEGETREWKHSVLPLPSSIFRRAFYTSQSVVEKLKRITENKVFNSIRFNKWDTHKILERDNEFVQYLPDTKEIVNAEYFHRFIDKYKKVILKPSALSRGRGICFIDKIGESFNIYDYRTSDSPSFFILKKNEINEFIVNNFVDKKYIIQQHLNLATINGAPFDIRVVMGKSEDKNWYCRGIECRKAGQESRVTNISRGGQALNINNAIKLAFGPSINSGKIKQELISLAIDFCKVMDKTGEHFAEFGLDFAIDSQRHYWFIEANVRPAFRGFKSLNYPNYLHIRHMPLLYAASIAGFGKEERSSEPKIQGCPKSHKRKNNLL